MQLVGTEQAMVFGLGRNCGQGSVIGGVHKGTIGGDPQWAVQVLAWEVGSGTRLRQRSAELVVAAGRRAGAGWV